MLKFFYIVLKNLMRTYRAKRFIAISLISPVILVLIIGFIFSGQSLSNVKIGVIGNQSLLANIGDVGIVPYKAEESCLEDVKQGSVHACVVTSHGANVTIFTDFSKISLANSIVTATTKGITKAKGTAETKVISSILLSAEGMRNTIKETAVKLTAMRSELTKSRDALVSASEKQKALGEMKSKIEKNQRDLRDFESTMQNTDAQLAGPIATLTQRKKEFEKESAVCTEVSIAVTIGMGANDCTKSQVDINQYKFLLAVSCSNYTALLNELPLDECNTLNIADALVTQKLSLLNAQKQEIDSTLSSLQSMRSTIQTSKGSITNLQNTLDSLKSVDTGTGLDAGKLSDAIKEIESSEKNLASNLDFAPINIGNQTLDIIAKSVIPTKTEQQFLNIIAFVLLLTFSTVLVSSALLLNERSSPAFIRNFISPTNEMVFFIGIFAANFFVAIMQASIFFIFLIVNGTYLPINITDAVIALFLIESALVLIGMLLALLFEKRETAILGTVTTLIILLILSGILIPVEKMSGYAYLLGKFSPIAMIMEISRKVMLFNLSLNSVMGEVVYLSAFSVVMFFVVWFINRIRMRF